MSTPLTLHPLANCKLTFERDRRWDFETDNQDLIESHWQKAVSLNPKMWNGRQVKVIDYDFADGIFSGTCVETSFAAYLTWRDHGAPDRKAGNLFGSSILKTSDGALIFGKMSSHTANAGRIYPPGGNLDPSDIQPDGSVDLEGSTFRELYEETGISRDEVVTGRRYLVFDDMRICAAIEMTVEMKAADLRDRIMAFSDASEEQELQDALVFRTHADLNNPAVLPYARRIAEELLPA